MSESQALRHELKLTCAGSLLPQVRSWMRLHPAGLIVANPPRRVNSLYLDTPGLASLAANLDGLRRRDKVRWRWYGDQWPIIQPYLERKRKRDKLNSKDRLLLPDSIDMAATGSKYWRTFARASTTSGSLYCKPPLNQP